MDTKKADVASGEEKLEARKFSEIEGHEFLRDPATLLPSEVMEITVAASSFLSDDDGEQKSLGALSAENLAGLAGLLRLLEEKYVTDLDGWRTLAQARGVMHTVELGTAYLGEFFAADD
jgi:hypothetical protein|nr:MAG TPA: hypothetical protein [Caudoviricetes sp.]